MPLPSTAWGKSIAINLFGCEHDKLIDPALLEQFIAEIITVIGMKAHGPCHIDQFGEGSLHGLSAMQFIETSSITVHLDDVGNRAFVDVFSCKDFDAERAQEFAQNFFGAKTVSTTVLER